MFWTLIGALLAGCAGLAVYIFYMRKGQFDDCEDVKYQIFHNEDDHS